MGWGAYDPILERYECCDSRTCRCPDEQPVPPGSPVDLQRKATARLEELVRLGCRDRRQDDPECFDPETGEHKCETCDHENPKPDRSK